MSITDELREWAKGSTLSSWTAEHLTAIADRIDAEHEKAMSRAGQLLADAEKDRDYNYANWQDCKQKVLQHNITLDELSAEIERLKDELAHRIELPKDADGEYIHVGDVMEWVRLSNKPSFEVRAMRYDEGGWEVYDRLGDRYVPSALRHYHAPTVEDVLRDFALAVCKDDALTIRKGVVEEYAAKLRLAEGEDA